MLFDTTPIKVSTIRASLDASVVGPSNASIRDRSPVLRINGTSTTNPSTISFTRRVSGEFEVSLVFSQTVDYERLYARTRFRGVRNMKNSTAEVVWNMERIVQAALVSLGSLPPPRCTDCTRCSHAVRVGCFSVGCHSVVNSITKCAAGIVGASTNG